jgi:hypothetical protein
VRRVIFGGKMDFSFRTFPKAVPLEAGDGMLRDLVRDCELAFTAREQRKGGEYSEGKRQAGAR